MITRLLQHDKHERFLGAEMPRQGLVQRKSAASLEAPELRCESPGKLPLELRFAFFEDVAPLSRHAAKVMCANVNFFGRRVHPLTLRLNS